MFTFQICDGNFHDLPLNPVAAGAGAFLFPRSGIATAPAHVSHPTIQPLTDKLDGSPVYGIIDGVDLIKPEGEMSFRLGQGHSIGR